MEHNEETDSLKHNMPLNAGDTGYGSVMAGRRSSETTPLLIPEPEPEVGEVEAWKPLTKEELEATAGGVGWRRLRTYLVAVFWLSWLAMLATAVAIIVTSPRPAVTPLRWWQRALFYQLEPTMGAEEGPQGINALCEQLPYLRSLGIGALILEGLFKKESLPSNGTAAAGDSLATLPQIQLLLAESSKAGLKVLLDVCNVDLHGAASSNLSTSDELSLKFWLEQGVAGFAICDTDAAYSAKTLLQWRGVFTEFNAEEEERIVVVKQTKDVLPPLDGPEQSNATLVDIVMKAILPSPGRLLSEQEVADAIETHLQTRREDTWPSWTIGGKTSEDLKKLLLVLMMTLPGSPTVQYDEEIYQTRSSALSAVSSQREEDEPSAFQTEKARRAAVSLFTSLSHSRAREEALLYGSFNFLPFNTSSNSSSSNATLVLPPSPPVLAFLRSWGCVHFLVLLNVGSESRALEPAWAPSLPEAGVFVTSTELDRLGSTSLYSLVLRPHEAMVIKLFEGGSYSSK